jgi:hypothetical protein
MEEEPKRKERKKREERELDEAFMAPDIHPQVMERLDRAVRIAAEQGCKEVQVLTFRASYCNDGGRRINNMLPDPLGYKLHAQSSIFRVGCPARSRCS